MSANGAEFCNNIHNIQTICILMLFNILLPAVFFPQDTVYIPADLLHFFDLIFERVKQSGFRRGEGDFAH